MLAVVSARARILVPILSFAFLLPCSFEAPAATAKKTSSKQAVRPAQKSKASKSTARKKSAKAKAPARPRTQQSPDPERIREIQAALLKRGYDCPVSGVWDSSSAAALAQFQQDHNIKNLSGNGKLDPLTLIALGLGPQRERDAQTEAGQPGTPEGRDQ
jgi:peptidoglycan hydrolase-like protein with peptidoglycan-binding domain